MLFTFDFTEVLNFDRFKRQAYHYMAVMPEITYFINVSNYKLTLAWKKIENAFQIDFKISEISIIEGNKYDGLVIKPLSDIRFKELPDMKNCFLNPPYTNGIYNASSVDDGINFMVRMIKILHKINKINIFI